jgi:hypothetical protein
MAYPKYRRISVFKHVQIFEKKNQLFYRAQISKLGWSKCFDVERDAAVAVDKKLLENGMEAVNILIPKK